MNIFLDSNTWLDIYKVSPSDLDQLEMLLVLVEEGQIKLYVSDQVSEEVVRNRPKVIADALRPLKVEKLHIPSMFKRIDGVEEVVKLQRDLNEKYTQVIKLVREKAGKEELPADELVRSLLSRAQMLKRTKEIIDRAKERKIVGNPPGKKDSHGDEINWEILLEKIDYGSDLHLITADKDFYVGESIHPFLEKEWRKVNTGVLKVYKNLQSFFSEYYPKIKLADEMLKAIMIGRFRGVSSFRETHSVIGVFVEARKNPTLRT